MIVYVTTKIYESNVFGVIGHYAICANCGWQSRTFDSKPVMEKAVAKHNESHFKAAQKLESEKE